MTQSIISPKYRDAACKILEYVKQHALDADARLPSERDFCALIQASQPTINKAVTSLIAEGHLRREGRKLFVAAPMSASAPPIHVLCPHAEYRQVTLVRQNLVEAAHDVCATMHTNAIPILARDGAEQRQQLLALLRGNTSGFVIWPITRTPLNDLLQEHAMREIPFVVCDLDLGPYDYVGIDNQSGSFQAVQHLHGLGHRQIAMITDQLAVSSLKLRCDGYQYACYVHGLHRSIKRIIEAPKISKEAIAAAFDSLRRNSPDVTAIFCSNDLLALYLLTIIRERGLHVPEDYSIIGFDGIDAGEMSQPALTTIAQDFYPLGVLAVERLYSKLRQKKLPQTSANPWRTRLEPSLIVRSSTGQAKNI